VACGDIEFRDLVKSLIGSYNNSIPYLYPIDCIKELYSIPQTIDLFGATLEEKFDSLSTLGEWDGANTMGSAAPSGCKQRQQQACLPSVWPVGAS
jgi:hypothetical protein